MSQWTHVNAAIRYNYLDMLQAKNPIENGVFGTPHDYYGNAPEGFASFPGSPSIPFGSEGSLDYRVTKTGEENSLASRTVIFWGDLRDYDDVEELRKYFNKVIDSSKYTVRTGVLEIGVEGSPNRVYLFDDDEEEWVEYVKKEEDE